MKIWNNQFVATGEDDAQSSVLLVAPSFNASLIGAGPTGAPLQPLSGSSDFKAYNIDFENRAVIHTDDVGIQVANRHPHPLNRPITLSRRLSLPISRMQMPRSTAVPWQVTKTLGTPGATRVHTSWIALSSARPTVSESSL